MTTANTEPKAHSHGLGQIPVSKLDTHGSKDVDAFPVPNGREEEWRFTPLRRLKGLHDWKGVADGTDEVSVDAPEGVTVETVGRDDERLGKAGLPVNRVIAQAYTSFEKATVVTVPQALAADKAITIDRKGLGGTAFEQLLIDVKPLAEATVIITNTGTGVRAGSLDVHVGEGAKLTLISLQEWDDDAVEVSQHNARVGKDASLRSIVITLGGDVVRLSPRVSYDDRGGNAELYGLYFAGDGQHHEHRSLIDHNVSNTRSRVDYKGALNGKDAHAVWIGDVIIGEGTTGTDSYENNRNLQLTDDTRVDSVPNLEIFTGEVAGAGHASASGRLDDIHLFYLRSRGIPEEEARRLIIRGYFLDIVNRIDDQDLRDHVMEKVERKLSAHE
ncbi:MULTISPECIES: Fe-S cluster assembly protein SufD [unclassified Nocardiopsis]|uniref:Fe-S cluster assembly protein SufD n=1 Tax=unclassified Nocardiopsis TaxID=2649073 RepID=UPI00066D21FF|nr:MULTISPECIES: Fe-S cluster assembly protein SufD [unclassified Nocardiopsis]MBQ1081367.1 Fe-S cluster assembly protein SufD [Nocardiopsis sp. B62]